MNRIARLLVMAAFAASLASCGVQQSIDDAKAEISTFHADLDARNFDAIWDEVAPDMRSATQKSQFVAILEAVNRKLGRVVGSKQVGWNSNVSTSGSFVTVTMETKFQKGSGVETFIYRKVEDDRLALAGYNIQSQEMMLN
ncbi:hypothetical protein B2G71_06910 [Novosphingobium sp. PC22D]|uniref:DUF4019 domain-containing protein n=1 Tax=Novosphingobium sp. PC22D TaxID=1962403 RepID=UPI000BF06AB4|nr:DUF4019 domain-containing protein [Novosphingobium sp. PC22D]PEQ13432.1 hypothetical protein B2G71_06910 [Novosphingobium sp. PC22D]